MDAEMKTEGQRLLLALEGTETDLAAKAGCAAAAIGHWRRGRRVPGAAARHKLELLYAIPRRAWEVAPGEPVPAPPETEAPPETSQPQAADSTLATTRAQIDAILAKLDRENSEADLTEGEEAKARDTLSKLLALRARLERDRDLLEDRVVREHPEWVRTKAAILEALRPYPEAAQAVAEALR
jgi:transcriptional regulator with XRE-family HTH domain